MTENYPVKNVHYKGFATDSIRWESFIPRDDDIFICTPYKCGTTWSQAICASLIFRDPDHGKKPAMISPWVDSHLMSIEAMNQMLDNQTHRRFFKTHTPLDGIDYYPSCTYIAVYRDPRDTYFSLRNHIENMNMDVPTTWMSEDVGESFRKWAAEPNVVGAAELFTLAELVHHYRSFRKFSDLANVHFFHYSELKVDLNGQMQRLAQILDVSIESELMSSLVEAAEFESMKKKAEQYVPASGMEIWKDEGRFFHKGTSGQWLELSEEDLEFYYRCMGELVVSEDLAWLQGGTGLDK